MRSKRQRKQKDNNSLKRKAGGTPQTFRNDLSGALLADGDDVGAGEGSNALALEPKAKVAEDAAAAPKRKVSKAEQRKLDQIARDKELKARRQEALALLEEHHLADHQYALLKSSAQLGQRETKRQRIAREFTMQKAGMALPADSVLERRRPTAAQSVAELPVTAPVTQPPHRNDSPSSEPGSSSDGEDGDHRQLSEEEEADPEPICLDPAAVRAAVEKARAEFNLPHAAASDRDLSAADGGAAPGEASGRRRLVAVSRPKAIRDSRAQLPIIGMEQEIVEAVLEHDVVVLAGETGCGKTTQVPQFLYEAGYGCPDYNDRSGMIGVTQPRRVAAIASAQRVAAELGTRVGDVVGYQVRYDRHVGEGASMKFMTDGILLREVQGDFLLRRYSCIIIDEAHERSLNTDLLIGMLSRIVPMRRRMARAGSGQPLKLVIMSATLRTGDFLDNRRLFPQQPPLLSVSARQYPVTLHFSRRTELHDYVGAAYAKVSQIHRQQPPGGILVFVTGQREVEHLCQRLRTSLGKQPQQAADPGGEQPPEGDDSAGLEGAYGEDVAEAADEALERVASTEAQQDDYEAGDLSEEEETGLLGGTGFSAEELAAAEKRLNEELGWKPEQQRASGAEPDDPTPVHVLPLYAMLPRTAQDRVFEAVPAGHRLIVVATNVAETSLTIPGIRYVVDPGRAKQKILEPTSGMARYEVGWISKASSEQRAGRAGRTAPGHCYRLFSSAVFNDQFEAHTPPEILNTALEGVVLVMKAMGIEKVENFPFPTPPDAGGLLDAQRCLLALGAMQPQTAGLTELGKAMAGFPIAPRSARLILQAAQVGKKQRGEVLAYAVALAAATSLESPFAHASSPQADGTRPAASQARLKHSSGDALSALAALLTFEAAPSKADVCESHGLHAKSLGEMAALHRQLRRLVARQMPEAGLALPPSSPQPPPLVAAALCKAVASGWADRVARRARSGEHVAKHGKRAVRYQSTAVEEDVFLHPKSNLHSAAPEFVVCMQLVRSPKRAYMAGVTEIQAHWLVEVAAPLCEISEALDQPPPAYAAASDAVMAWHDVTFGRHAWQLPRLRRPHPDLSLRVRAFAAALLDGSVLPCMAELRPLLAAAPAAAAKSEAQGLARIGRLTSALLAEGIDSRASLHASWQRNPRLLQPELAAWMKKGQAATLLQTWSRLLEESAASRTKPKSAKRRG